MVMISGWRVVPIILKMFCCFWGFLRFLICRVLFDTRQSLCRVSEKKYSTKNPLPIKYLSSIVCRVLFAECKMSFVECLGHSAKKASPVVM